MARAVRSPDGAKRNPGSLVTVGPRISLALHPGYEDYEDRAHAAKLARARRFRQVGWAERKRSPRGEAGATRGHAACGGFAHPTNASVKNPFGRGRAASGRRAWRGP